MINTSTYEQRTKLNLKEHLRLKVQQPVLLRPQQDAHHLVGNPRVHPREKWLDLLGIS